MSVALDTDSAHDLEKNDFDAEFDVHGDSEKDEFVLDSTQPICDPESCSP